MEKLSGRNDQLFTLLRGYERRVYWIVLILIVAMYLIVKRYVWPRKNHDLCVVSVLWDQMLSDSARKAGIRDAGLTGAIHDIG
jgi:hypothetical protein